MRRSALLFALVLFSAWLLACEPVPTASPTPVPSSPTVAPQPTETVVQTEAATNPQTLLAMPQMVEGRAAHTATLLPDGTVLLAGGFAAGEQVLNSAERFHPKTNIFTPAEPMNTARQSHTATLLPNGKVLLAGGYGDDYLASAELYDSATGRFVPTGSMNIARSGHLATLLDNGKVLVTGGVGPGWSFLATAELYDPATGTFTPAGEMTTARESHTATLLNDGRVIITGGHQGRRSDIVLYDSAELYDPATQTFTPTGSMTVRRHKHDATLLADGRVFISGGSDERDDQGAYTSTELYDPATGTFTASTAMHAARYKHTGTSLLLPNGQVLLAGGAATTELYDPKTGVFRTLDTGAGVTRLFATATLLPNGSVLFAGGYGPNIAADAQAWVLDF